jgi:hypothetical protein
MALTGKVAIGVLAAMWAVAPAAAVPPPPTEEQIAVSLPDSQCRVPIVGTVRAYAQPVHGLRIPGPTVLRVLADSPDPALLFDIEHGDTPDDLRPVATGVGLAGGDVRIALPAAGAYRLRLLMTGDAARTGRHIEYRLSLSRAMESGAPPCREDAAR